MEEAIIAILNGVDAVPKCGYPGTLIVFDQKNAFPILTGDDSSSVVFAVAEYGNGRIFVTSHEAFLTNFQKFPEDFGTLWGNIKKWLLKEEKIKDEDIKSVEVNNKINLIYFSTIIIL